MTDTASSTGDDAPWGESAGDDSLALADGLQKVLVLAGLLLFVTGIAFALGGGGPGGPLGGPANATATASPTPTVGPTATATTTATATSTATATTTATSTSTADGTI